jgi:GLPGLI family protein
MKNFFLTSTLLIATSSFSQKFNVANYSCLIHLSDATKQADMQFNLLSKAEEVAEDVNFRLEFNNETSAFYVDNDLEIDAMSLHMLKAITNTYGIFFTKVIDASVIKEMKPNVYTEYTFGKENILIKDSIFNHWEITSETKIINGYKCYKANYLRKRILLNKERLDKAIAWFCPEIPVSYGPTEFSGLPGLIFHLQANEHSFVLKNIIYEENLSVKSPSKGTVISYNEYLKVTTENMEKLTEMVKTYKD